MPSAIPYSCTIGGNAGTSMAAPTVSGVVALVREYFMSGMYPSGSKTPRDAFVPSGSLLKAMIIAGAQPMRFRQVDIIAIEERNDKCTTSSLGTLDSAPDNEQGFGRVQLDTTVAFTPGRLWIPSHDSSSIPEVFSDKVMLVDEEHHMYEFCLARSAIDTNADAMLHIVLAWTDIPEAFIVNNLDLSVTIDGSTECLFGNGGAEADVVNVVESIRIPVSETPGVSAFQIKVGNGGIAEPQPYSKTIVFCISF